MKTYVYWSKSNNAIEAVVATNRRNADKILLEKLKSQCKIIRDDYVLMTTVNHKENETGGFNMF